MSDENKPRDWYDYVKLTGLYLGVLVFASGILLGVIADSDRRADTRAARRQLDAALKKSIDEQKNRANEIHKRLDAIEAAIKGPK